MYLYPLELFSSMFYYLHVFWVISPVPYNSILIPFHIAYTKWPHMWFQISNSIAYFFLQLVEAKLNKDNRKCTTPSMNAGTRWSIFNSNCRDRRVFHVTSSILVPSVESTAKLSFPCRIWRHCFGNTSCCIRRATTRFSVLHDVFPAQCSVMLHERRAGTTLVQWGLFFF